MTIDIFVASTFYILSLVGALFLAIFGLYQLVQEWKIDNLQDESQYSTKPLKQIFSMGILGGFVISLALGIWIYFSI